MHPVSKQFTLCTRLQITNQPIFYGLNYQASIPVTLKN